jgi:hypothetical protein
MPPLKKLSFQLLCLLPAKGPASRFFLIQATAVILEKRKAMLRLPGAIGQIYKGRA